MQTIGQNVLSMATVLQSYRNPRTNVSSPPTMAAVHANEDIEPLSLGSVISPTYDSIGASLNPMLSPISTVDTYSRSDESVTYSVTHPRMLGMFAKIMHRFLPNFSCKMPDRKLPVGWNMNSMLPGTTRGTSSAV